MFMCKEIRKCSAYCVDERGSLPLLMYVIGSAVYPAAVPMRTLKYLTYHFLCGFSLETDRCVNLLLNNAIIIIIIIIIIIRYGCLLSQAFSSWYFSWTSGDPHRSGFKLHTAVLSVLCVMFQVFCSESIECFPGTASKFFLKLLVTIQWLQLLLV